MSEHLTPVHPCPQCGRGLDAATNALKGDEAAPTPGDFSVCLYCHTPLVFTDDLTLRRATDDELRDLLRILKNHILRAEGV